MISATFNGGRLLFVLEWLLAVQFHSQKEEKKTILIRRLRRRRLSKGHIPCLPLHGPLRLFGQDGIREMKADGIGSGSDE